MKFVGLVGTNAEKSYNRTLLQFMAKHFDDEFEVLEIKEVPMFNQDEAKVAPESVQYINDQIEAADGVVIATPEHNHSIPSALKNILEWLSFELHPLENKPVMIVGGSYQIQGSSRAQLHLRQVLDAPGVNANVMPGNEFLMGNIHEQFDNEGNINNEGTISFLGQTFDKFKRFTEVSNLLNVPEEIRFEPGTYSVSVPGHNGDIPVEVTFTQNRIETIDIDQASETKGIADNVFEKVPQQIIAGQTLNIDAVAGASVTTDAVVDGVADAANQAGGNADALRKRPKYKEEVRENIAFEAGTYKVQATGHNAEFPVEVTFSNDRIESIKTARAKESKGIADAVFDSLPQQIVDGQTLNVDTISGATVSSNALLNGVAKAAEEAGANPDTLRNRPKYDANKKVLTDIDTDVVVVGAGGAGLSAAAVAVQNGKKAVVLEKFPSIGGNTTRTGGPMNASDPEWQYNFAALGGEEDTLREVLEVDESEIHEEYLEDFKALKEEINAYLEEVKDMAEPYLFDSVLWHRYQTYVGGKRTDLNGDEVYGNYDLVKTMTDKALESIKWLENIGVEFNNENVEMPVGANWRRGHKPLENEGYAFVEAVSSFVEDNGGKILTEISVKQLIQDKSGKVIGLKAETDDGQTITVNAQSVVLASGGFGANTEMLQKYNTYWKEIEDDIATSNSPAITGDGILLGEEIGADLVDMGLIQMLPTTDPKTGALFVGLQVPPANFIIVNQEGKRFVNEYESRDVLSAAAIDNGGLFYLIADENIKNTAYNTDDEKIEKEIAAGDLYRADTLAELAEQLDMNPNTLADTIATYNNYVDEGYDPDFHKNVFDLKVEKGPFYATPRKPAIHHTMGGLKIDKETHVINKDGEVINGLYAAGEVAGGLHAGNRLGGNSLTDIFTFGRIAGDNASKGE